MPTYDYACSACQHHFETFQSMKDDPLSECPACGQPALKRLIGTGAGIIFKGSGFYETDYKPKTDPASKADASSPAETKSPKADGSSEKKSENSSSKADSSSSAPKSAD